MRILVTGGAGYIGSHAIRQLARHGYEVVVFDNLSTGRRFLAEGFELVVGDLRDHKRLASTLHRVDAVMHFAAHAYVGESVENPRKYFENNVQSGLHLLNTALKTNVRYFIFSSTCAVYGVPSKVPITEETVRQPVNPYGASKLFFENALDAYSKAYGLGFVSLRYFNAAGADESGEIGELHDPETHLIPRALGVAAGLWPELEIYGDDYPTPDGTCIRDFIHVNDLVEAHVLALQYLIAGGESTALNLGTGIGYSVKEIVSTVETVTGRPIPKRFSSRRPGDPAVLIADASRAEQRLHWKPCRNLQQIVSTAWKWVQHSREVRPQQKTIPGPSSVEALASR
jgi:UDP-glucose-4-epimerase GalE